MQYKNKKYPRPRSFLRSKSGGGYLFADLMVALAVLGFLLGGFAISLDGFGRFNHYQLVRQRCVAAAQAELDSIAITGEPISERDFKQLWPKISVSVEKADGAGQWKGLKLVKVKTKTKSFNKDVEIELSRYILVKGGN